MTGRRSPWFQHYHPMPDASVRLVCFPHAGGTAPFFLPMAKRLADSVDVLAVQYPGRQDRHREPCLGSIVELAEAVVGELGPWLDRPVALFGHSMGASVAFEVARRVRVLALFVSGRPAPSRHRFDHTHAADDDALIDDMLSLDGTSAQLLADEEILRMVLGSVRADYVAAETYRYVPGAPVDCPIVAMIGDDDPKVTVDEARAWGEHTRGPFELVEFAGGHFYLNTSIGPVADLVERRCTSFLAGRSHDVGSGQAGGLDAVR